jgi:hypothetical protein
MKKRHEFDSSSSVCYSATLVARVCVFMVWDSGGLELEFHLCCLRTHDTRNIRRKASLSSSKEG